MNKPNDLRQMLDTLAMAQAEEPDLGRFFDQACTVTDQMIGHRLFTILTYEANTAEVVRLYSSQPHAYPAGGRKQKGDSQWSTRVLDEGQPYIGRNTADIQKHFADHDVITGLGLASILNMPVRRAGQTLGTINLLHSADHYLKDHLALARLVASIVAGRL